MTAPCYLGVDGGGTKTRFVLLDGDQHVLAQAQLGSAYHPEIGLDGVRSLLAQGVQSVLADAALQAADITYAFFGLPAHGEDSAASTRLDAIPAGILGHDRYACDNDMVCGWAGSMACADGINIVAGTGSIGYGQYQGRSARAGGWGEMFSDEGSAYWIAMQGLNAWSRMSDGRLPRTAMYAVFHHKLQLDRDLDICAQIYGEHAQTRAELAQFSRLVSESARLGDPMALRIYRQAGEELAQIADAIRRDLGFGAGEVVPLSCSGGAFSAGELLLAPFRDALHAACNDFQLREPLHEPHIGAALYAMHLAG